MSLSEDKIRSFIAIELPQEVRRALGAIQEQLKLVSPPVVKWVDPAGIHLTLKFLGYAPAGQVAAITRVMAGAVAGESPFCLEVSGLGVFPSPKRVQVAWVGLAGDIESLCRLQGRIESGLVPLGFEPESRAFTAHLTLARVREQASPAERQKLGDIISRTSVERCYTIEVKELSLMRSQLFRTGAIYTRIGAVALGGALLKK
jgi:2'-5' RNA ligase